MSSVSLEYVLNLNDANIIDIRDNYTYNLGHIKGAINIPYYNLLNNFSHYLSKNKRYYLYCSNGRQSQEICNRLNSFGYDTLNIDGGYEAYQSMNYY